MSESLKNKIFEVGILSSFALFIVVLLLTALSIKPQYMRTAHNWTEDVIAQENAIVTLHVQYAAHLATQ